MAQSVEIKQIKGNTFCIDTGMTYIPFYRINKEEIIMLDTGWSRGEREGIEGLLQKQALKVAGILNSHAHIDHIGNNAYFKKKYNCVIAMSAYEAMVCSSTVNLKLYYSTLSLKEIATHLGHLVCPVDIMISDKQDSVQVCGIDFKILHTPGHSPSHLCILTPDDVAYLGDTLMSHDVMNGSKMPYAFILSEDLKSKEKLYDLKCSQYVIAHKGIYSNITELITDNINFYKLRAEKIYEIINDSMTLEEIMQAITKSFNIHVTNVYKYTLIERMLRSYVEYLNELGRLELSAADGFLKYSKIK